ncbi:MAG: hypothetical protein KBE23_21925 [Chloroflexi bacterium]|nr:hypothetical protein [Chloroflexota bacterium]MBP7045424.1 hypothetical protein [Chloroflexota bacterium]
MPAKQSAQEYQSYLMRFRRVNEQPLVWHVSIQDVRTGEWRHFTDLALLFEFVSQELSTTLPDLPED